MSRSHAMTARRRAALRKAQRASARKRRGHGGGKLAAANRRIDRIRNITVAVGTVAAVGTLAYGSYVATPHATAKIKNHPKVRAQAIKKLRTQAASRRRAA